MSHSCFSRFVTDGGVRQAFEQLVDRCWHNTARIFSGLGFPLLHCEQVEQSLARAAPIGRQWPRIITHIETAVAPAVEGKRVLKGTNSAD